MIIETLQSLSPATRSSRHERTALVVAVIAAALSGSAWAEEYLEPIGGGGGGQFEAHCPANQFLAGFQLRAGDDVDAIRPLCVTADGPRNVSPAASESNWYGGPGGGFTSVVCTMYKPVVTGMYVAYEGVDTVVVNSIHLYCGLAADKPEPSDLPSAVFDAPTYKTPGTVLGIFHGELANHYAFTQRCPAGQVAMGVHGRSGKWLDAIGLICGAPRVQPSGEVVKSIGRVNTGTASKPHPAGWTICDSARDARARNSPAAPNLEAQCAASKTTVKSIGRVSTGAPSAPAARRHICDSARDARARNSPAAPNLEAQCLAAGGPPPATPEPPPLKPEVSGKQPPSARESRDAAIAALIGSVVSGINESRRDSGNKIGPRGPGGISADGAIDVERDERRSDQGTTQVDQGASPQALSQPDNSIRVAVRYPTAFGYKERSGEFDAGPNSCGAFYISVLPASGARPREPTSIATQDRMRRWNGMYVCDYLISELPLNESVTVRVAMSDQRAAGSEVWLGGSEGQPPAGRRRTIVEGDRQVVLTAARPRASLDFEMAYSGSR